MLNNIELKWLYDAVMLEELRSFTLAAERRNISQSSFSRRIQALENAVGFEIFDRSASPLQLSLQGRGFIVYARNLLGDIEYQIGKIKGGKTSKHRINIAAAHSLSISLLPELISGFSDKMDKVFNIESINVDEAVKNLKKGKSDFILSFFNDELITSPFLHHKVLDARLYLVSGCSSDGKPLYRLEETPLPLMKYTDESYMGRQVNQLLEKNLRDRFHYFCQSSMSELLKRMVLDGHGVGWLPDYSIREELRQQKLSLLEPEKTSIKMGVFIYRTHSRLNPTSERFWQYMRTRWTA
ncbi:LysR family transcriptional regulator [Xenorhabdus nematophila]|uniref:LysR substrate-binding domain-containing protein n=1 Tax=Xenorhabdus nematophila TaxID=628 RepID=UPI000542A75B|nr:LysR substrate-binding domain-containing protein [Xenorhabdus nematophila]CEF30562.1 putative LysR-family transcriptional regulator [Xenorhabdus nematophila str. Websteri]AYA41972.1 LysR family transcriptional regulator [Xenorhabdus nematophila]KHD27407.1 cell density-dependent motility repressor [Xenorhabdus nematophila]MBA0020695.1 LysR family transcriptional regulator [Xenorhabdus nematophila]MCB4426733.1 LysR family transcriptional regulator [Xenorhabdus nematophila]